MHRCTVDERWFVRRPARQSDQSIWVFDRSPAVNNPAGCLYCIRLSVHFSCVWVCLWYDSAAAAAVVVMVMVEVVINMEREKQNAEEKLNQCITSHSLSLFLMFRIKYCATRSMWTTTRSLAVMICNRTKSNVWQKNPVNYKHTHAHSHTYSQTQVAE